MKNTKAKYLILKTPCSPCVTILPRTGKFALNAYAEDLQGKKFVRSHGEINIFKMEFNAKHQED